MKSKVVIVGATSAMAKHCARGWVTDSDHMILIGRDAGRTQRAADDLRARQPECRIDCLTTAFDDAGAIQAAVESACDGRCPNIVLIAHGSLPDQTDCQNNLLMAREALEVNAISPVLFAEAFANQLERAGMGMLVVISSVAGDRGRQSNYVYGAAKGLITRYVQGLQHRLAHTPVRVVLVKPGPTETPMTAHLQGKGVRMASVESVANDIVRGVQRRASVIYTPYKWALIMMIIRHLPSFIFNRLKI